MGVLFVHERAGFYGGVEQNIADSVQGLRRRSVPCHLAYSRQFTVQPEFARLFDSVHACGELDSAASILPTLTLSDIAAKTDATCVYLHKVHRLPDSLDRIPARMVQMVHDHDLCCPRRHKYFACSGKICDQAAGWRCYLDGAFLARESGRKFGIGYQSIRVKLREMQRRQKLDLFLVASEFMRQELSMNNFPDDRIVVLPLAVNKAAATESLPPVEPGAVLYVGQLIRGKGVDLLLQALAKVRTSFHATIVGKGNAENSLRALAERLGLTSRVTFRGWVDNQELPQLYAQAQLVAVPSRWPEPFGMVGLESMRHGRPVVGFDVGGIPDWLSHQQTGLLVPPANTDAMAAAIKTLLTDPLLAERMGSAGRRAVEEKFGFDSYISELQKLLTPSGSQMRSRDLQEVYA